MKGLLVSIVDVLGIFVPGFLLLMGILLFPPLVNDLFKQWVTWAALLEAVRVNLTVIAILSAISAYVLGFILRLCSIFILKLITFPFWANHLKKRAEELEKALEAALNNEALSEGIRSEAKLRPKYEETFIVPFFPFARRIIQYRSPSLYSGVERLEAEIRFASGIFIPLLVFTCDGLWLGTFSGYALAAVSGVGAFIILVTFPIGRVREVVYIYHMALIVLQYPSNRASEAPDSDA